MQKFKSFVNKSIFLLLIILFLTPTVEAEFYRSGLEAFTKTKHQLTVPILAPQKLIELKTESKAVIKTAEGDHLQLKKGTKYYLSRSKFKLIKLDKKQGEKSELKGDSPRKSSAGSAELAADEKKLKSGWGVQLMASSKQDNALEFKNKLAEAGIEPELNILREDGLFKVLAGAFKERGRADQLAEKLAEKGFKGWVRKAAGIRKKDAAELEAEKNIKNELKSKQKQINSEPEADNSKESKTESVSKSEGRLFRIDTEKIDDSVSEGLSLYNRRGERLARSYLFKIKGHFQAEEKKLTGEYQFGPLGNSILFSYKSSLEELTAHLLQNNLDLSTSKAALKAQAVLYRTALLYQIEIQGARLESLKNTEFKALKPPVLKAVAETEAEVLIKDDEFFYNSDYSFRKISQPRRGLFSLAKANYNYREIINYYYDRSQLANLNDLLDSEVKYEARIESGLYLKEIRQVKWTGPRVITVLDYDLNSPRLKLKPVLAKGIVPGREDLAELIKKHSALAGVNGGYFDYTGRPLGLIYINGELVSEPLYNRSSLLISEDNQISFARVDWQGTLLFKESGSKVKIDGINRKAAADELILFNHYYGPKTAQLEAGFVDIVVRDNQILGKETTRGVETPIPPDGFILRTASSKNDILNLVEKNKNSEIELDYKFKPDFKSRNIIHAVGAGPQILKNAEVAISGQQENFQDDIILGRAPRTAVGLTEANHLLIMTIDGRQSELSVGMTLEEAALTLKELGAVEAINLDGGGSARMVIRGFTMSNPSEKRPISNGVLIENN